MHSICKIVLLAISPVLISATVFAAEILLTWEMDVPVSYYKVYYGTIPSRPSTVVKTVGDVRQITLKNIKTNTMLYYKVTAVHFDGSESSFSNEISKYIPASAPTNAKEATPASK